MTVAVAAESLVGNDFNEEGGGECHSWASNHLESVACRDGAVATQVISNIRRRSWFGPLPRRCAVIRVS